MTEMILGFLLIVAVHSFTFQLDAHALRQPTTKDVWEFGFTWWIVLLRFFLPVISWTGINLLYRRGGTWFTLLSLTLVSRLIQITTFGIRYHEWPQTRDWAGVLLAFAAVIVTMRIK